MKKYIFPGVSYVLGLLAALFWTALRINWSGISKFLGADTNQSFIIMELPLLVCIMAWVGVALALVGLAAKCRGLSIAGFAIAVICTVGGAVVVYFGAWDYLSFIMVHFWKSFAVALGLNALAALLFFPIDGKKALKWGIVAAAVVIVVVLGYELRPCSYTNGAVVYAVEDDYQIVFSTSDSAMAWVSIGGEEYYDLYAGSARSADRVHKVTVPQSVLDAAGAYTVHARQMIYRGPFGGYMGKEKTEDYSFRAVDSSDGLDYASISDVHSAEAAAAKAALSGNELDFLVMLGDMVGMVETEKDANTANRIAHAITGGEIPVIYARGNHEIKGEYGEKLYKYVGSLNQGFNYTVTLGEEVFAVVMDMGEDHEDDWWEYYGTAKFDVYRAEQTEMLRDILAAGEYEDYEYRMLLCHIPVVYIDGSGKFEAFRQEWTPLLNEMGMDIGLSGHKHKLWYFLPGTLEPGAELIYSEGYSGKVGKSEGGTVAEFDFPNFLVGQRSLQQTGGTQKWGLTDYVCLHTHVDIEAGTQVGRYINSLGEVIEMAYPFVAQGYEGTVREIVTELN